MKEGPCEHIQSSQSSSLFSGLTSKRSVSDTSVSCSVLVSPASGRLSAPPEFWDRELSTRSAFMIRNSILSSDQKKQTNTQAVETWTGFYNTKWKVCPFTSKLFIFLPLKRDSIISELFLSAANREIFSANWSLRSLRVCSLSAWIFTHDTQTKKYKWNNRV